MKLTTLNKFTFLTLMIALAGFSACAHEISHTESDKPGWFGGRTHQETTVYQNPNGTTSSESSKSTTTK